MSAHDQDGFHRVTRPAVIGRARCPSRPESTTLGIERPEVATPPAERPPCCAQRTITVPTEVNAKTAQKHANPSKAHRHSFARRTVVERACSSMKDPASTDVIRGWIGMSGLSALTLVLACAVVVRNVRGVDASRSALPRNAGASPQASRPASVGDERSKTSSPRQPELFPVRPRRSTQPKAPGPN